MNIFREVDRGGFYVVLTEFILEIQGKTPIFHLFRMLFQGKNAELVILFFASGELSSEKRMKLSGDRKFSAGIAHRDSFRFCIEYIPFFQRGGHVDLFSVYADFDSLPQGQLDA
ncbi:MAG: hypothetical protein V8T90_02805 [Victivallales bacterium]